MSDAIAQILYLALAYARLIGYAVVWGVAYYVLYRQLQASTPRVRHASAAASCPRPCHRGLGGVQGCPLPRP